MKNSDISVWGTISDQLAAQMTQATHESVIAKLGFVAVDAAVLHLSTKDTAAHAWATERLRHQIERTASRVLQRSISIEVALIKQAQPVPVEMAQVQVTPPTLSEFDFFGEGGGGWLRFPHYGPRFYRPYIGDEAFDLWEYLRSCDKDASAPWTEVRDFRGKELADQLRCSVQRITGVWRTCPVFDNAYFEDGEVLGRCCGRSAPELLEPGDWPHQTRPIRGEAGRPACRHWVPGALEILQAEGLAVWEKRGSGPRNTYYSIQVYQQLPLLVPKQVELLASAIQVKHARFLRKRELYQPWSAIQSYSMLAERQHVLDGLVLPQPSDGVLRADAYNPNGSLRAEAYKALGNSLFFRDLSCAAGNNRTDGRPDAAKRPTG